MKVYDSPLVTPERDAIPDTDCPIGRLLERSWNPGVWPAVYMFAPFVAVTPESRESTETVIDWMGFDALFRTVTTMLPAPLPLGTTRVPDTGTREESADELMLPISPVTKA